MFSAGAEAVSVPLAIVSAPVIVPPAFARYVPPT
jgi:hypothetical protein